MAKGFIRALAALLAAGTLAHAAAARADEIFVLSSTALREVVLELLPQFEKASGHKLVTAFSSSPDVLKRVQAGERADVVILASSGLEELLKSGKLAPGSRVDLAKSGVSVAVRAGALRPDIGSADAVKRAVLAAKTVGFSGGASGTYIVGMFQRLGIADEAKSKSRQAPPGVAVGELIVRGEVELGFHQLSELIPVAGIDIIGPLPPELQQVTTFTSGIHAAAKNLAAARALLQFLASPAAAPVVRHMGMEPG